MAGWLEQRKLGGGRGGGKKTEGLPAPHVSETDETGKTSPFLSPQYIQKTKPVSV